MKYHVTIGLWLMLGTLAVPAQDPVHRVLDKRVGLSSNTIYDLLQDARGYIWIAHDKGLSRYDGFGFVHYTSREQRGKSLSNLMEDSEGRIWCQNFVGQFFYTQGDSLAYCRELVPSGQYSVAGILDGYVLVTMGSRGIRYLDTRTGVRDEQPLKEVITGNHYTLAFNNRFYFINRDSASVTSTTSSRQLRYQSAAYGLHYGFGIDTSLYYAPKYASKKLKVVSATSDKMTWSVPDKVFVQKVTQLSDSTAALLTTQGVYLIDRSFSKVDWYFPSKNISAILRDREGSWWLGTLQEGILFIPSLDSRRVLSTYSITALDADTTRQALYMGTTNNELLKYSPGASQAQPIIKHPLTQEILSVRFDAATNTLAHASDMFYMLNKNGTATSPGSIKDIAPTGTGAYAIAAGTYVGLNVASSDRYASWATRYPVIGGTGDRKLLGLYYHTRARSVEVVNEEIYAATASGLMRFTKTDSLEIRHQGNTIIAADLEKHSHGVYAATYTQGILKISGTEVTELLSPSAITASIFKLRICKNKLWALAESSLLAIDLNDGSVTETGPADGFPPEDIRDFVILRDTVWLSGSNGLVYFPASLQAYNEHPPTVLFTRVLADEEVIPMNDHSLRASQNDIRIGYSIIAYKASSQVRVLYKINDEDWKPLNNSLRELRLPSLSPGKYTVRLKAKNEDGVESIQQPAVMFIIESPIYLQTWFLILVVILVLATFLTVHRIRLARLRQKNKAQTDRLQLEQALQQSLLASIKAQMNPHFIHNALSSIQSFVYADDKERAIRYLDNFSDLTRNVLDMSNQESITLREELNLLETYISLERMRVGDSLRYEVQVAETLDPETIRMPAMIVQPFVENAIRHGLLHRKGEKILHIEFSARHGNLHIVIEDNGVGRKMSRELNQAKGRNRSSFSTSANQQRLALLNARNPHSVALRIDDLTDEFGRGTGTRVHITIPNVILNV